MKFISDFVTMFIAIPLSGVGASSVIHCFGMEDNLAMAIGFVFVLFPANSFAYWFADQISRGEG